VQDPATAESPLMPASALAATRTPVVLPLDKIGAALMQIIELRLREKIT
jgi:hypothetical protein